MITKNCLGKFSLETNRVNDIVFNPEVLTVGAQWFLKSGPLAASVWPGSSECRFLSSLLQQALQVLSDAPTPGNQVLEQPPPPLKKTLNGCIS